MRSIRLSTWQSIRFILRLSDSRLSLILIAVSSLACQTEVFLCLEVSDQNVVRTLIPHVMHARYMLHTAEPLPFGHQNNIMTIIRDKNIEP